MGVEGIIRINKSKYLFMLIYMGSQYIYFEWGGIHKFGTKRDFWEEEYYCETGYSLIWKLTQIWFAKFGKNDQELESANLTFLL